MKEYLHNKDFLPDSFVLRKNKTVDAVNKRDSRILTLIAFLLLPLSIGNIKSNFKEIKPVISEKRIEGNLGDKSLYKWLNIADKCYEGNFTKNEGNVYVYDKQNLESILQDENIVINTMEDLGENKYRLQVIQKEIYK